MSTAVVSFNVNEQVNKQQAEHLKRSSNSSPAGTTSAVTSHVSGNTAGEKMEIAQDRVLSCSEHKSTSSDGEKQSVFCYDVKRVDENGKTRATSAANHSAGHLLPSCSKNNNNNKLAGESGIEPSGAAAIEEDEDGDLSSCSALPAPLRSILSEVARNGDSESLSWHSVRKPPPTDSFNHRLENKRTFAAAASAPSSTLKASVCTAVAPIAMRPRAAASFLAGGSNGISAAGGTAPPRKKQRNGIHGTSHRKSRQNQLLKRPLHLIRGSSNGGASGTTTTTTTVTVSSPSMATAAAAVPNNGRFATSTSGSEPEDTSQYDSEGTSTTSNSELSFDQQKQRRLRHRSQHLNFRSLSSSTSSNQANLVRHEGPSIPVYATSLREAFRVAIGMVLDAWFQNKGGYTLSPAEKRIHKDRALSAKEIFLLRKERLLQRLGPPESDLKQDNMADAGPPFTIQRIAEVLVSPEKYYTQTHKLCNCLEKLLLVSSPFSAFGGSQGGVTSQSRREEQELAALADERIRIQSEFRQLRRRRSSLASDSGSGENLLASVDAGNDSALVKTDSSDAGGVDVRFFSKKDDGVVTSQGGAAELLKIASGSLTDAERREQLEAAARASLRSKFDHVGIDPHHHHQHLVMNANTKTIADSRSLTNSPPPPNLTAVPNLSGGLLRSPHATAPGEHPTSPVRPLSPILFSEVSSSPTSPNQALSNPNMHILQMHHAAAVAGVSPFELMALGTASGTIAASSAGAFLGSAQFNAMKEQDLESRSSASSDVDSESDDISFDDSASDRSDGSDSGFAGTSAATVTEGGTTAAASNFSAVARAMALKRHQQTTRAAAASQQRTTQKMPPGTASHNESNGIKILQESIASASSALLPASDEMVPEDSDVSDSSLSDMAE